MVLLHVANAEVAGRCMHTLEAFNDRQCYVTQAQSTLLQQPNALLIQSQALAPQMPTQPSALHSQLLTSPIGSLQQQVSTVATVVPVL